MADPAEGLAPTPVDTCARMTLRQLRLRWGGIVPDGTPDVVDINGMSHELWLRCDGRGRGDDSVYQLEREYGNG